MANPACLVYKCNAKFIEFIQSHPRFHNDIKSNIGKHAILNEVSVNSKGIGKVRVTLKQPNQGNHVKVQTIKALDEIFSKFTTNTYPIQPSMQQSCSDLDRVNQNCLIKWNFLDGNVTVTGPTSDVENFAKKLQMYRSSPKTTPVKNAKRSKSITDLSSLGLSVPPQASSSKGRGEICLSFNASDQNVLNFITSYHFYFKRLEQQCRPFGRVELNVDECKVNVFRRQKYDDSMRKECFSVIAAFLKSFFSTTSRFDPGKLKALYAARKELFKNPGPEGHPQVVASFDPQGVLTVCGERAMVPDKMEMIRNHLRTFGHWDNLKQQRSKQQPSTFVYQRRDPIFLEVLKFVVRNPNASNALKTFVSKFGTFDIVPNTKNPEGVAIASNLKNGQLIAQMSSFFNEYVCVHREYNERNLQEARQRFPNVFDGLKHLDVYIRWINAPMIVIVGLEAKVQSAILVIEDAVKNVVSNQPIRRTSNDATENSPFVYQKAPPAFPAILKFVLSDNEETQKLRQAVRGVARYEAIPNIKNPTGLKLHPLPHLSDPFFQTIGPIMKSFFAEYSFVQKTYEADKVRNARKNIPSSFWELQHQHTYSTWRGNTFLVSGVNTHVQTVLSMVENMIKVSGGSSSEETKSENQAKSQPVIEMVDYHPPKKQHENLLFIVKYSVLKTKLNETCQDICKVSGKNIPLHLTPTHSQNMDKPTFLKLSSAKIKEFLSDFVIESVEVGSDAIESFKLNQPQWLSDLKQDKSKAVGLLYGEDCIKVGGLKEDVKYVCDIINQHSGSASKRKPCSKDICRILINCEVIKQVNEMFAGQVQVTCSLEKELVEFKGQGLSIQAAEEQISSMKLIERTPQLTELKLDLLKDILEKEISKHIKKIYSQFAEENVRGALVIRENQVILVATDGKDFTHGCSLLERLIHMNLVSLPADAQRESLPDLMKNVSQADDIIVAEKDNIIWVVGFEESEVDRTTALLKTFFNHSKSVILNHACNTNIAKFVVKHFASDDGFPSGININVVQFGLQLLGPAVNTHKALKYLQSKKYRSRSVELCEQGLEKHTSSDQWKAFVGYMESQARCSIDIELDNVTGKGSKEFPVSTSPRVSISESDTSTQETKYGDIIVQVCHDDITKDASEVVVNGCTNDFNLARGPLSKAILNRAGKAMQEQCLKNPLGKTSVLRVTNGFKMPCQYVIHLVTPRNIREYSSRVRSALDYAAVLGCASVAIPTMGAGRIGLNPDLIASFMAQALRDFASGQPTSVKLIRIVVFDKNLLPTVEAKVLHGHATTEASTEQSSLLIKQLSDKCSPENTNDKVNINITFEAEGAFEMAQVMINSHLEQLVSKKTSKDEKIGKFGQDEWIDFYQIAADNNVAVVVSKKQPTSITISGLSENVSNVNDHLKRIIFELHQAQSQISECVWKWTKPGSSFVAFSPRVSMAIEKLYKARPKATQQLKYRGDTLILKFATMIYTVGQVSGKLQRVATDTQGLPSHWVDMEGAPWIKVFVHRESDEFAAVERKLRASNPSVQLIIKVERIQNPPLYEQYQLKKKDVARHMITKHPVERELFHGTSEEDANSICAHGFDRGFAGKHATLYGKGSYFATDSAFAAQYASPSGHLLHMFMANVITGDYCKGNPSLKAPPAKVASGNANQVYDSVVNDMAMPSIFVVFKDSSVYPTYLIAFK